MSDNVRAYGVKFVVAGAMLAGMLLSWNLWRVDRFYPFVPVSDSLPAVDAYLGAAWFYTLLTLLFALALLPDPLPELSLFLPLVILLALWDQTRWQPWVYQYVAMLICLAIYPWRSDNLQRQRASLNACRLIVAGTYLYSGLQKFNISFAMDVYPWLIEPLVPASAQQLALQGALLPPVVETFLGVALLLPPFRLFGVLIALGMHSGILYCLGPCGHNWNTVVWPWNLAMMAFVVLLFLRTPDVSFWRLVWPGRSLVQWAALVLFLVMPAFNFVGQWDAYLSASLYSGNTVKADVVLSPEGVERLPPEVLEYVYLGRDGRGSVSFSNWAIGELNVPPYPAERVYRGLYRALAVSPECELIVHHPPNWLSGERKVTHHQDRQP